MNALAEATTSLQKRQEAGLHTRPAKEAFRIDVAVQAKTFKVMQAAAHDAAAEATTSLQQLGLRQ
jgi:hypothetical protein